MVNPLVPHFQAIQMDHPLTRYFNVLFLLLSTLLGLALGQLAAVLLEVRLSPDIIRKPPVMTDRGHPASNALSDYEIVVQRNLFDPNYSGGISLAASTEGTASSQASFVLLGTVTAGKRSLAVIDSAGEIRRLHLGDTPPGGGLVVDIKRNALHVRRDNGREEIVPLRNAPLPGNESAPARNGASGQNSYVISQQEVNKARSNINELLKQARLEPNIIDGQTRGFVVRMIQPNSLFSKLGLQLGDVVMQVNRVPLDSPEKALQIFQQLREARRIAIGLQRNGTPMNFEYALD